MAADFKVARPVEYYQRFLKEDIRPDGRGLDEFRENLLNQECIGNAEGSALVKLGNTAVICGIKAELAEPTTEEPEAGYLITNLELPALCCPRFRPGAPTEQSQVLSQFLSNCCESCELVSRKDLCIEEGKLCWVLYADLVCLNYDGNIIDAALVALLAALHNTSLPKVKFDAEKGEPELIKDAKVPLKINASPVCTSFAVIDNTYVLVDPTDEEESLSTGSLNVVVTSEGQLCSLAKPGGTPFDEERLQSCISRALTRSEEVVNLINSSKTSPER